MSRPGCSTAAPAPSPSHRAARGRGPCSVGSPSTARPRATRPARRGRPRVPHRRRRPLLHGARADRVDAGLHPSGLGRLAGLRGATPGARAGDGRHRLVTKPAGTVDDGRSPPRARRAHPGRGFGVARRAGLRIARIRSAAQRADGRRLARARLTVRLARWSWSRARRQPRPLRSGSRPARSRPGDRDRVSDRASGLSAGGRSSDAPAPVLRAARGRAA